MWCKLGLGTKKGLLDHKVPREEYVPTKTGLPRTEILQMKMLKLTWPGCVLGLGIYEEKKEVGHRAQNPTQSNSKERVVLQKELMS